MRRGGGRDTTDVGGRMEIQLGGAVADPIDHPHDIVLAQMPALMKSNSASVEVSPRSVIRRRVRRDSVRKIADSTSLRVALSRRSRSVVVTLARKPDARHFVFDGKVNQNICEQRYNVEIQMAVDMIEVADESRCRSTCARSSSVIAARIERSKKYRMPAATGLSMKSPDAPTAAPSREPSSMLRPRQTTACSPTSSSGLSRASSAAARAAGSATIRLALRKIPSRCARVIPALTSGDRPKSSALTMRRFKRRHRDYRKHGVDFASIERLTQASFRGAKNEITGLILLFYAFAREIAPFKRRLRHHAPLALDGLHGFRAEIGGKEFAGVGHGIGHRRATEAARIAFDSMPGAELVIGTGVVGALSSGLKPGDLVLSDRVLTFDGDGQVGEKVIAVADSHLRAVGRSLSSAGIAYSTGAILTSHRVLATGAEKRRAKETTGAIAVDMETAAIAAEAAARGLPFVAIRAVLDEVDDEVFGAEMADADGNVRPLAATHT